MAGLAVLSRNYYVYVAAFTGKCFVMIFFTIPSVYLLLMFALYNIKNVFATN